MISGEGSEIDEQREDIVLPGPKDVILVLLLWFLMLFYLMPKGEDWATHYFILELLGDFFLLLAVWVIVCLIRRQPLSFLGLKWPMVKGDIWKGIGLGVLLNFINMGVNLILTMFGFTIPSDSRFGILKSGLSGILGFFLIVVILGPFVEEIFNRGFVYQAFKRRIGVIGALIVSSLIFGLAHFPLGLIMVIEFSCLGAVLCYYFQKKGNLTVPIFAHASYNLASLIVVLISHGFGSGGK